MKTDVFQSCGHCWVFQICWHIECSTFTVSSFRIWNSSTGIPSPPLALFVVMLSKAHLTSQSRMSGSRLVITPSWCVSNYLSVYFQGPHPMTSVLVPLSDFQRMSICMYGVNLVGALNVFLPIPSPSRFQIRISHAGHLRKILEGGSEATAIFPLWRLAQGQVLTDKRLTSLACCLRLLPLLPGLLQLFYDLGWMQVQLHGGGIRLSRKSPISWRWEVETNTGSRLSFSFFAPVFSSLLLVLLTSGPAPDTEAAGLHRVLSQVPWLCYPHNSSFCFSSLNFNSCSH